MERWIEGMNANLKARFAVLFDVLSSHRIAALRKMKKKFTFKMLEYTALGKLLKKIQKKEPKYFGDSKTLRNFATANGKQRGSPLKARKRKLKTPL